MMFVIHQLHAKSFQEMGIQYYQLDWFIRRLAYFIASYHVLMFWDFFVNVFDVLSTEALWYTVCHTNH